MGIRFTYSERLGKASLAVALEVLGAIGKAADEKGYTETAFIIIWKLAAVKSEGFGTVDLVYLNPEATRGWEGIGETATA